MIKLPSLKIIKPLFAVFVWGLSFIATKVALREVNPETIVFIRQLLGLIFLFFVAKNKNLRFNLNWKNQKWILLLAIMACFHLWIQITGLKFTSATNTGWIIGITPVFMIILAMLFFKEKITRQQTLGIFIAFAGLLFLVSKGKFNSLGFINNKGDLLVIASSFTWSVYSLINKRAAINYSPILTTFYLFLFVAIIIAPFTITKSNFVSVLNLSVIGWLSILFLGIFCSGIAYTLWAQALTEMSTSKVAALLYLEPFVTFFGSWYLLKEEITILTLVSGLIIIGGVILVNRK